MSRLKRAISCALLVFIVTGSSRNAEAAANRIIVKLNTGSPIDPVLNLFNASVLDVISDSNLYLLQVPQVPSLGTLTLNLLGITYIEVDTTLSPNLENAWRTPVAIAGGLVPPTTGIDAHSRGSGLQILRRIRRRGSRHQ